MESVLIVKYKYKYKYKYQVPGGADRQVYEVH